jgi:quercetin dioxygenase-like cupin family protein
MHRVRRDDLPFQGHSHEFEGAHHGGVRLSAFLFDGPPGSGPKLHRHPYDEVLFVREGRARYVVAGKEFEAEAGDILVVKAGEVHSFTCIGKSRLVQIDVHLSSTFVTEWVHDPREM